MPRFERFPGSWRWIGAAPVDRLARASGQVLAGLRIAAPGAVFRWEDDGSMLMATTSSSMGRIALRPADLVLMWLDPDHRPASQLSLHSLRTADVVRWAGLDSAQEDIRFDAFDRPALGDLARLLNNADDVLSGLGVPALDPRTGRFMITGSDVAVGLLLPKEGSGRATWFRASTGRIGTPDALLEVRSGGTAADQAREVGMFVQSSTAVGLRDDPS